MNKAVFVEWLKVGASELKEEVDGFCGGENSVALYEFVFKVLAFNIVREGDKGEGVVCESAECCSEEGVNAAIFFLESCLEVSS